MTAGMISRTWRGRGSGSKHRKRLSATYATLFTIITHRLAAKSVLRVISRTAELPHDYFFFSHKYPDTLVK